MDEVVVCVHCLNYRIGKLYWCAKMKSETLLAQRSYVSYKNIVSEGALKAEILRIIMFKNVKKTKSVSV